MNDWPGDTTPLPHQVREDRLAARFADLVAALPWRVDHLPKGTLRPGPSTWHPDEPTANAEVARLRREGCAYAVAWQDSMEEKA
jgi:hypothetical protein